MPTKSITLKPICLECCTPCIEPTHTHSEVSTWFCPGAAEEWKRIVLIGRYSNEVLWLVLYVVHVYCEFVSGSRYTYIICDYILIMFYTLYKK